MAKFKVSELTAATTANQNDLMYLVQSGASKSITIANFLEHISGNIIPSANSVQDLGSPTRQWKSLYVSNNTIYIAGTPLSIDRGQLVIGSGGSSANLATQAYVNNAVANIGGSSADIGDLVITGGSITTGGVSDIYLAPNGEGYAWINIPSDASAANGAATVIGNGVNGGSGVRIASYNKTWYFKPDGTMVFPSNTINANTNPIEIKSSDYVEMFYQGLDAEWQADPTRNQTTYVWTSYDGTFIQHTRGANGQDATWDHQWAYKNDGSMKFPTLTVPISDNANPSGTGQTLKFTDPGQQAIIYGPPSDSTYVNAQRIIIQGAPGYTGTAGEGGDVYVWAGPGGDDGGNGGDIKVRAGQGIGSGTGGYLNFQAGDSSTGTGGYINIESGSGGVGGDIDILARNGGAIDINAQGGGEVGIHTQSSSWYFSPSGVMSFPNNKLKVNSSFGIETSSGNVWTFAPDGTIFFPNNTLSTSNLSIKTSGDAATSVSNWEGGGGWNQGMYSNVSTTGGTGTGLTVDVAAGGGGYINIEAITINNPGSGYTNGDVITINNENNIPGTFTIGVLQPTWTFANSKITFPDSSFQTGAAISITALKVLVAASTDFADFQTRIAAL